MSKKFKSLELKKILSDKSISNSRKKTSKKSKSKLKEDEEGNSIIESRKKSYSELQDEDGYIVLKRDKKPKSELKVDKDGYIVLERDKKPKSELKVDKDGYIILERDKKSNLKFQDDKNDVLVAPGEISNKEKERESAQEVNKQSISDLHINEPQKIKVSDSVTGGIQARNKILSQFNRSFNYSSILHNDMKYYESEDCNENQSKPAKNIANKNSNDDVVIKASKEKCKREKLNNKSFNELEKRDERLLNFSCDDIGNADRVKLYYKEHILYDCHNNAWLIWNGKYWSYDKSKTLRKMIENVMVAYRCCTDNLDNDLYKEHKRHSRNSNTYQMINAVAKLLEHHFPVDINEFDKYPYYITVNNGIVDLRTGELIPHDRELLLTEYIDITYTKDAQGINFDRFLNKIFANDDELINYAQTAFGYSTTGEITEQCIFIAYGGGANGKSTLNNCVKVALGGCVMSLPIETLLEKRRAGGASPELATARNKRVLFASENEENVSLRTATVKMLTSNESMSVRHLYGHLFEYIPKFKLWIGTNHLPKIKETDHGTWRRIRVIPFNVTIKENEKDTLLMKKLEREKEAIFAWLVKGAVKYYEAGKLPDSSSVSKATKEYQQNEDTVQDFINSFIEPSKGAGITASDLFDLYTKLYPETEGGCTMTSFGRRMKEKGYGKVRRSSGVIYKNLKFKQEVE